MSRLKQAILDAEVPGVSALAMSPDQAHQMLGKRVMSRGSFYNALHRGEIPSLRCGKRFIIPKARFLAWLESAGLPSGPTAPAA